METRAHRNRLTERSSEKETREMIVLRRGDWRCTAVAVGVRTLKMKINISIAHAANACTFPDFCVDLLVCFDPASNRVKIAFLFRRTTKLSERK